jgi:hypothetical protein
MDEVNLHSARALCAFYAAFMSMAAILAGCAGGQQQPTFIHVCPTIPLYSKAFELAAGQQLAGLPPGSPDVMLIEDYLKVRAEARNCK